MKYAFLLFLVLTTQAIADFSDDQFPQQSDILTRIIASAKRHGFPLRSYRRVHTAFYLRSAEYIGSLKAPFGTVHIAYLVFTPSEKGRSTTPVSNLGFVLFLDRDLNYRARWNVPTTLGQLSTLGTKLMLDDAVLFDYAHFGPNDWVHIENASQPIPQWK